MSYCGLVDARISTSEKDLPVYEKGKKKEKWKVKEVELCMSCIYKCNHESMYQNVKRLNISLLLIQKTDSLKNSV